MSKTVWLLLALAGCSKPVWQAPSFAFQDQQNHTVSDESLRGKPWIADFIFTECTSACPLLTARMETLARRLAGANLAFVSFSVDPAHDTPAVLADYARRWGADPRWHLLATTVPSLAKVSVAMKVTPDPLLHSNRFFLVDAKGQVRGAYDSTDSAAMNALATDAAALSGTPLVPLPADGAKLYADLGCQGCHEAQGPALDGLAGHTVQLDDGQAITANDAYIRESIVDPQAKLVAGYAPTMPAFGLDPSQLDTLVEYVKMLPQRRQMVTDPVCKMKVPADGASEATAAGQTWHFCSTVCRERFLAAPSRYVIR